MGPSGSGKSTLGRALAARIGCNFLEGDDFHSSSNRAKMAAGAPLGEDDRVSFLDAVGRALADARQLTIAACSALRKAHRNRLRSYAGDIIFVWLEVEREELERRVRRRRDHFMPASLVASQLEAFEPPDPGEDYIRINGTLPLSDQIDAIEQHLAAFGHINFRCKGAARPPARRHR